MENTQKSDNKAMNVKYKDPVCGMLLEAHEIQATVDYEGKTYHFCSQNCAEKFKENPKKYAKNNQDSQSETHGHDMSKSGMMKRGGKNMKKGMMGMDMRKGGCGGMRKMKSGNMGGMSSDQTSSGSKTNEALEILKNRYAKGEITRQEYEEIKKEILD